MKILNRLRQVFFISALTGLAACGGGGSSGGTTTSPTATSGEVPVLSAVGTPTGAAVTQSIDTAGGTVVEPSTGASVKVAAGAFSAATDVTVQPATDTLPFGSGDGITVTTAVQPGTPLIVTMSYANDGVTHPSQLGLAVQADDGSWLSIEPVRIDTVAKTIAAALPSPLATATGVRATAAPSLTGVNVRPGQTIVRYIKWYMKPDQTTVHVGKTVDLVPYVRQSTATCPPEPPCDPNVGDDCLLTPPSCRVRPVIQDLPFTNDKPGYTRTWYVNTIPGGDTPIGTVAPNTPQGATFTAPATKPSPNTVEVLFGSEGTVQPGVVFISADVTITDGYVVKGDFSATQFDICAYMVADVTDHFEVTVRPDSSNSGFYVVQNFVNQASVLSNKQKRPTYDGTATGDDAFDMAYVNGGQVTVIQGVVADEFLVTINGTSTSSMCTGTDANGVSITVPSITVAAPLLVADFFADGFQNGKQTLPPVPIPNSSGVWTLTVEQQ